VVGNEIEHSATVDFALANGKGKFKLVTKPDFLDKVLSVLPTTGEVSLELRDGLPLIFRFENYVILLASMEIK